MNELKKILKGLANSIKEEKAENGYSSEKYDLSRRYRHHHLAYGFLRGRGYEEMEAKVGEGNKPDMGLVKKIVTAYSGFADETHVRISA